MKFEGEENWKDLTLGDHELCFLVLWGVMRALVLGEIRYQ
jgi:hypothetical protein